MKPLEEIFFKACIHESHRVNFEHGKTEFLVRDIVNIFSRLGFSHKQLWRYLEKWTGLDFYDYGVTLDLGWFEPGKFTPQYEALYKEVLDAKGITSWENGEFVTSMSVSLNARQTSHVMASIMMNGKESIGGTNDTVTDEFADRILQHLFGATGVPNEIIIGSKVVADEKGGGDDND